MKVWVREFTNTNSLKLSKGPKADISINLATFAQFYCPATEFSSSDLSGDLSAFAKGILELEKKSCAKSYAGCGQVHGL